MFSMSVLCPLCAQTSFSSIDALRCSLIKAANGPLACPICHELFLGLDKLTIHLFSHTNIMNSANSATNALTTPTSHNQYIKNVDKLKTQQTEENPNRLSNNSSRCHDTEITQTHLNHGEVNFADTPPHLSEKNALKKPKVTSKADKTIVNKSNRTQQHQQQQVGTMVKIYQEEPRAIENLAQCDICEFTFRNEELRNMHIRLVHQNFDWHENSNVSFGNKTIKRTTSPVCDCKNSPEDHDFKCHLCAKTFKTKGSLRIHLKVVHLMGLPYGNNSPKLTICDRIRYKENKLLKLANATNNNSQQQIESLNATSTTLASNNCNVFNISPAKFITNLNSTPADSNINVVKLKPPFEFQQDNSPLQTSNLVLLFNRSGPAAIEPNLNTLPNSANANPATNVITVTPNDNVVAPRLTANVANVIENPKIWECDVCSKAFTTKYFLKKHKRLHTGEMPYSCELCARTFTFQQSYHKHLLYHSDEKPHVCSTCGRAFKELSTLHNHERIHSGEKPFKCDVCGKSFRQRVSFLVHNRIHTGVMPYKCEICQRSFRYKVSQRTHKCQPLSAEASPTPEDENDSISENFIKAFLETSAADQANPHVVQSQNSPASNEIADINEKALPLSEQQALLTKTIDDIVVESCNKMGIVKDDFTTEQIMNEGSMSPSQQLQNMRLYSPQLVASDLNCIEGDLTRFFLQNSQTENNLL